MQIIELYSLLRKRDLVGLLLSLRHGMFEFFHIVREHHYLELHFGKIGDYFMPKIIFKASQVESQ